MIRAEFLSHNGPELVFDSKYPIIQEDLEDVFAIVDSILSEIIRLPGIDDSAGFKHFYDVLGGHAKKRGTGIKVKRG
jgi:hypothetical protein